MTLSRKSGFDSEAYELELIGEKLLDGLSEAHYPLAGLHEMLVDPLGYLGQPRELLDRLDGYLMRVTREIVQAQRSITEELG